MLSLTIVVLVTTAAGFIVWANDKRHAKYGMSLPAGVAVAVAALSWIIFMAAGFGYQPGLTWIPWVLPMALGTAAAVGAVAYLGRTRARYDTMRLTAALKL
jgi:sterol desaturase/sphingolipid hydroxylase (fatty acid hydroxylase superfamily)